MRKLGQRFRFTLKAFEQHIHLFWRKCVPANDLDRNFAFKTRVIRLVDCCHATLAQPFKNLVTPKILTDESSHGFPYSSDKYMVSFPAMETCELNKCERPIPSIISEIKTSNVLQFRVIFYGWVIQK